MEKNKLTKHSKRNLGVIENFILHLTHCSDESEPSFTVPQTFSPEELYRIAYDYVLEDHVDGEDSEEAFEEKSIARLKDYETFIILDEEIFMSDDLEEENPVKVFCNSIHNPTIFVVPINPYKPIRKFRLTKPQSIIEVQHRWEILNYVLGTPTDSDEVTLRDIFMHGKYVTEIV